MHNSLEVKIGVNIVKLDPADLIDTNIVVSVSLPTGLNGGKDILGPEERLFEATLVMLHELKIPHCTFLVGATGSGNALNNNNTDYFKKTLALYDEKTDGKDLVAYFNKIISPLANIQENHFITTCQDHIKNLPPDQAAYLNPQHKIIRWEDACNEFPHYNEQLSKYRKKYSLDPHFRQEVNATSNDFLERHKEKKLAEIQRFAERVRTVRPDLAKAIGDFTVFFKLLGVDYVLRENSILGCYGELKTKTLFLYPKEDFSQKFISTFKEYKEFIAAKALRFRKRDCNKVHTCKGAAVYGFPYIETQGPSKEDTNKLYSVIKKTFPSALNILKLFQGRRTAN